MTHDEATISFWSYATEDDRSDKGRILQLASDIAEEFSLIAGHPLSLFIDRNAVEWGDQWRSKIDMTLTDASFLIAVVTPRYFKRPECRRELLSFHAQAKNRNLERLLLPILYIDVADLSEDSSDEAVALIARAQFADWRTLRLHDVNSPEYRKGVNALAQRILRLSQQVESLLLEEEARQADADEPGISDTVEEIQKLLPAWTESVVGDKTNRAQLRGTFAEHKTRITKLRARRAPRSAVLATQLRLGPDVLPMLEKRHRDAKIYLSRSAELDPLVQQLIHKLLEHPDEVDLANDFFFAAEDAVENIVADISSDIETEYLKSLSHLSQSIKKAHSVSDQGNALIQQGNDIVAGWWNGGVGQLLYGRTFVPLTETDRHRWTRGKDGESKTLEGRESSDE
ncbi:MAG: toll/interleukin-1 receptor domain-containing protein [Actinoplanes sp.]